MNARKPAVYDRFAPHYDRLIAPLERGLLADAREVVRTVDVGRRDVNQAANMCLARRLDYAAQDMRRLFSEAKSMRRRAGLGAEDHDLDAGDRVGQRLVIRVGAQLDDGYVGREGARNMTPEELTRTDDQVQNCPILFVATGQGGADRVPDVLHHGGHTAAQLPPCW